MNTDNTESKKEENPAAMSMHNLIILDESGSMSGVRKQTVTGCNETLNGIRSTAKEDTDIQQLVSIYCFDTSNSRYLFRNVPIEEARDLTYNDYCPNACTPLYDAIGYTVTELSKVIGDSDCVGKVTIITDGWENASQRWNHSSVVELIESMKKRGWVFTFIGANIDVEGTAKGLGITSYLKFEQTDEGMADMFEYERRSQKAYNSKMSFMRKSRAFRNLGKKERMMAMSNMNENYFVDEQRITPSSITHLDNDEIFVFGSNTQGEHNGGAALQAARNFGAVLGQAEGIQGQSYAIPTVGCTFDELKQAIERFTEYVAMHPKQKFMLTAIGCGRAGYSVAQIAPLFKDAYSFGNVYVPQSFLPYMN